MTTEELTGPPAGAKADGGAQIDGLRLLLALADGLDFDRPEKPDHARRMAAAAYRTARELGLPRAPEVFLAGLTADFACARLTEHVVYALSKRPSVVDQKAKPSLFFHPILAFETMRSFPGLLRVAGFVRAHHEVPSGEGYPDGLRGDAVPLECGCLHLADQLDLLFHGEAPANIDDVVTGMSGLNWEEYPVGLREAFIAALQEDSLFERLKDRAGLAAEIETILDEVKFFNPFPLPGDPDRFIEALALLMEARFRNPRHRTVVFLADLVMRASRKMGMSDDSILQVKRAVYLKGLGEVFLRRGEPLFDRRLSAEEEEAVNFHPRLAAELLAGVPGLGECAGIILQHRENWDGGGYPNGLKGEAVKPEARLLRVGEAFCVEYARTSAAGDKKAWKRVMQKMRGGSGKGFDPEVVSTVLRVLGE